MKLFCFRKFNLVCRAKWGNNKVSPNDERKGTTAEDIEPLEHVTLGFSNMEVGYKSRTESRELENHEDEHKLP